MVRTVSRRSCAIRCLNGVSRGVNTLKTSRRVCLCVSSIHPWVLALLLACRACRRVRPVACRTSTLASTAPCSSAPVQPHSLTSLITHSEPAPAVFLSSHLTHRTSQARPAALSLPCLPSAISPLALSSTDNNHNNNHDHTRTLRTLHTLHTLHFLPTAQQLTLASSLPAPGSRPLASKPLCSLPPDNTPFRSSSFAFRLPSLRQQYSTSPPPLQPLLMPP